MIYKIPLFDLNFDEKEENAVLEILKSKWISTGPKSEAFEKRFAEMLNVGFAVSLSNCTVSLHLALLLLDIKPDDEVICPSLTFVATCNAIRYINAKPVFADIKSYDDLTINPIDIERKISDKSKAIIVMHYGGFPCNMDKIVEIAEKHNLKIIEDACHGPLSEYKGKKLGTIGNIGCFSFFANKNISIGEGGMLVTNDRKLFERAKLLRSHGMTTLSYERAQGHSTSYDVIDLGFNYRMDDIRAAIGMAQLDKIQKDLEKRALIRKMYVEILRNFRGVILPFADHKDFASNYIFTIVLENSTSKKRDKVREKLADAGIQTSVHYPSVHRFSIYRQFSCSLPFTEYVSDNAITLPMHARLDQDDVIYITSNLKKILENE